jgi:hypothetical protein
MERVRHLKQGEECLATVVGKALAVQAHYYQPQKRSLPCVAPCGFCQQGVSRLENWYVSAAVAGEAPAGTPAPWEGAVLSISSFVAEKLAKDPPADWQVVKLWRDQKKGWLYVKALEAFVPPERRDVWFPSIEETLSLLPGWERYRAARRLKVFAS